MKDDPVFRSILEKDSLASQPTLSRFFQTALLGFRESFRFSKKEKTASRKKRLWKEMFTMLNEREKASAGELYDPFTEGMPEEREKAHRLCKLYNDTFDTDIEQRARILKDLLPNQGSDVYLQGPIFFDCGCNTSIGDNSYANFNFTVLDEGRVTIGKSVFIGPNVSLLTPKHPLCWQDRNSFFNKKTGHVTNLEFALPITIEDNCWIGGNVTVCGGVTIGEGSVIGAGSVVTRDIPPNSLAAGVPCRVIREITEKDLLPYHPNRN